MQKMLALLGAKSKKEFVALLAQFISPEMQSTSTWLLYPQ